MKTVAFVVTVLGSTLVGSHAYAGVECINRVSNSVTTPDWHCSKHCGDWASTRPMQTLTLDMDKKFKDMGAFYKNPSASCSGGELCGYSSIPATPTISANGEQVKLSFKTWSRPVVVSVSADICILNSAVPPASNTATKTTPSVPSAPSPTAASTPKPPLPPQKSHVIEEAGPLADNCERMKNNLFVEAGVYCYPYNVNLASTSLSCSQSSDALFRKVSGIFLCMQ